MRKPIRDDRKAQGAIEDVLMPAAYVCHLAREFEDPASLLKGVDLEPGELARPGRYITVAQNLKCVANAMELAQSPDWYLPWGLRIAEYLHGPLTPALLTAPTLGEGLDAFLEYFDLRIPYMALSARTRAGRFEIELVPRLDVGELLPLLIEIPLLILQHYIGTIRNTPMRGAYIDLAYPAAHRQAGYDRWFECEVRFERGRHALSIPASWRHIANLGHDETSWQAALNQCEELSSARGAGSPLGRIRAELYRAFTAPGPLIEPPTVDDVARRLHVSSRTLIRRLRAAGTTYQLEIDRIRQWRAAELLKRADLPVGTIADALGFADAASFAKAFKRWNGVSPAAYRKACASAVSVRGASE